MCYFFQRFTGQTLIDPSRGVFFFPLHGPAARKWCLVNCYYLASRRLRSNDARKANASNGFSFLNGRLSMQLDLIFHSWGSTGTSFSQLRQLKSRLTWVKLQQSKEQCRSAAHSERTRSPQPWSQTGIDDCFVLGFARPTVGAISRRPQKSLR